MKGQAKTPTAALCALVIAVIIQVRHVRVSTANKLNVTVYPADVQVYPGTGVVVISCFIRNINRVTQEPRWYHEYRPNQFRVVSIGLKTFGQYHGGRFQVTDQASALIPNALNYHLAIMNFMQDDVGNYVCYVVNIFRNVIVGEDRAAVSIVDRPQSPLCFPSEGVVTVMEGSSLRMSCSSETVASPDNITLTWIPPTNTLTSWGGPQDADWLVDDSRIPVAKRLDLVVDNKFNNSNFKCATVLEEDGFLVYGHCVIGLIRVLSVPPGQMDVEVIIRPHEFPLRDGVVSGFTCDIVFTPPVSATDFIQRDWQTFPEVGNRIFQSSNPIQRNVYINILGQDSGVVLSCTVTFRGVIYMGNLTLIVARNASIPETTITYPTASTNSMSTRTLPPASNLPWYTEPSSIALICGAAAAVLLLFVILIVCFTTRRRRKHNRINRAQEEPVGSDQDSSYSPIYLNTRPVTVLSENIYHEASDPTADPRSAFGENIYHETVEPTSLVPTSDGNIYNETLDFTDPISAGRENVYHEAVVGAMVLPSNESQEDLPGPGSEPFDIGSPVPELQLYAETVENILYVPLTQERILEDGYSTVAETQFR